MKTKELGKLGESQAQNYLNSQNYQIIETNFYSRYGEIDIIVIDYSTNEIAFVEVKTRTSHAFGLPTESLTYTKRQRIIKTALTFLNSTTKNIPRRWRIDLIGIQLDSEYKFRDLIHIKNI
ncbi:MAG: YraN family protein [Nitrospirota bacterium]